MKLIDIITSPWAIHQNKINGVLDVYNAYLRGPRLDFSGIESKIMALPNNSVKKSYEVKNGAAVIPVKGVLTKNASLFMSIFYDASSMSLIRGMIADALADTKVDSIILDIDSPGGTVDGTQELANFIFESRGIKPITAYTDGMVASAAYWIASAADEIYISGDTVEIGSIGVITTHIDYSEQDKQFGIKVTEIYAGKYKAAGSPNKSITDEDKKYIQDQIDYIYSIFVENVARNRGVDVQTVLANMADAKIFIGKQAIDAGLVDGVSTLDLLLNISANSKGVEGAGIGTLVSGGMLSKGVEGITNKTININKNKEVQIVNIEILQKENPEVFEAVKKLGEVEALKGQDEKISALKTESAKAELERIKAVKEQSIAGHDALVQEMMFDGQTTGEQAAVKILAAEKAVRGKMNANFNADNPGTVSSIEPVDPANTQADKNERPVEDVAKEAWDKDSKIRAEFGNNFAAYLGYFKASNSGQARILGHKEGK